MSRLRVPPLAAALIAATLAFVAVALATDDEGRRHPRPTTVSERAGGGANERAERASRSANGHAGGPAGRAVFARMGCGSCHHLTAAGSSGQIGPDLDLALPAHTRASLIAKILSPGQSSMMPPDFRARMSDADVAALVSFLLAASPSR